AIFGENIAEIGKANQDSKEDLLSSLNYACTRWCYYQLNLFGDPTLTFYQSDNKAPKKPMKPTGEKSGTIGDEYSFSSFTTDPNGDSIYYKWDFGDGTFSEWLGPFKSGDVVSTTHQWDRWGRYEVKVKARDEHRTESDWSDPLPISMPVVHKFPLLHLLLNFLEKYFPNILNYLNEIRV
ncbi:MAG: PKD domain-containing protein, partial [Thermoplasmatales archaeon]